MKELIIFLKKHKVLRKFKKNFRKYSHITSIKEFCSIASPNSSISSAFHWSNTKEGHDFWSNLNDKWRKELL